MKKLSFIIAALLMFVGVSLGQTNVANVTESGAGQNASIDQNGILNKSYVTQSNLGNTANVTQINHNAAFSTLSEVNQSGENNLSTIKQNSNGSLPLIPNAVGTLKAVTTQIGNLNKALQVQGPTLTSNQQGKSLAEIVQSGNENFASQHQLRYDNDAKIVQTGHRNSAMQAQDAKILPEEIGSANTAYIEQGLGSDNTATQTQDGWANDVKAYQSGNVNTSTQIQQDYSWKSKADVFQSGNHNIADQFQVGNLNSAGINQESSYNTAKQTQTTIGASRGGTNYDPYNEAYIGQKGGDGNYAEQTQTSPGAGVIENLAQIFQDGGWNYATQTQVGGDNSSTISQAGNGNHAVVTQLMVP